MNESFGYSRIPLLLALLFLLLAWLLPNHYRPWITVYQEFSAFLAILFGLFSLIHVRKIYIPVEAIFFVLIAIVPFIQYMVGVILFSGDALIVIVYLVGFSAALTLGYNLYCNARWSAIVSFLAGASILASVLSGWMALSQWLSISSSIWVADLPPGARPFANLAQPNNLASLLFIGLFSVGYFYEKGKLGKLSSSLLALFILFCIALTGSRTSWVVSVVCFVFMFWRPIRRNARISTYYASVWLLVYFLFVIGVPIVSVMLDVQIYDLMGRAMASGRLELWWQMIQAISVGPLWGYGWSQVSLAQVVATPLYSVQIMTEHSHNIVLDFFIWNGPVLGAFFVAVIAFGVVSVAMRARSVESGLVVFVLMALLIHGLFEFPLEYEFFLAPLAVLVGGTLAEQQSSSACKRLYVPRFLFIAALCGGSILLCAFWREYQVIAKDYTLMRYETARIGELRATNSAPNVVLLSQLREFTRFARTRPFEGMTESELEWMRKVSHRYPYYLSLRRYALALALNGQFDQALRQLSIIRGLYGEAVYERVLDSIRFEYPYLSVYLNFH